MHSSVVGKSSVSPLKKKLGFSFWAGTSYKLFLVREREHEVEEVELVGRYRGSGRNWKSKNIL